MKYVFGLSSICLAVPFLFHLDKHADKNGAQGVFVCSCARDVMCGWRWPGGQGMGVYGAWGVMGWDRHRCGCC